MLDRPRIVLLRSATPPDPYINAFRQVGFDARCIPVLQFEPMGEAALGDRLRSPERFGGLILTSPRAAQTLAPHDLREWRAKPTFVVGPGTGERARSLGLSTVGETSGTANELARVILETAPDQTLLFLAGDRRRDALPDRLREATVPFEELSVYRTLGEASLLGSMRDDLPGWLAFFSPSGVEATLELDGISWNSVARAAIGPTTAEALDMADLPAHAVAASPTPEALAAAVSHAHRTLDV